MEARLHHWKFLATVKLEDTTIYTFSDNINNILNPIWAFCWLLAFLWKKAACCESQNCLRPQRWSLSLILGWQHQTYHKRTVERSALGNPSLKTPNLFCTSLSPSTCSRSEVLRQQQTHHIPNMLLMLKDGIRVSRSKSAHVWPSQAETSTLTAQEWVKTCKTK